jgi:tryptophan synthase alpha chain
MSRISEAFNNTKKALIVFIMAGDPSLDETEKLVHEIANAGADIIELGIPFSDSVADGPTIQNAANRALNKHTNASDILKLVSKIRRTSQIPLVLMTSFNIIYSYGVDKFIKEANKVGVDGLILPDLPVDEAKRIEKGDLDMIFLLAPNSNRSHIDAAVDNSTGFIYVVSISGTTGAKGNLKIQAQEVISKIRKITAKPVAIGFGISNPKQAKEAAKLADGIIVGSAVIDTIVKNRAKVGKFVSELKKAIS